MRRGVIALAMLTLAACSSTPAPPEPQPAAPPIASAAPPRPPAQSPIASAGPARDQCGAEALQALVGRPRTEIPIPLQPERQRVACTTCPVAQDLRPDRLNFLFDADTGLIRKISCG